MQNNRQELNRNLAQMLKGGVIMDVTTPEQAKIAEAAGACAVMALERIPADIRAAGGVSRMSDPADDTRHIDKTKFAASRRFARMNFTRRQRNSLHRWISLNSSTITASCPS